ncbi:MAG: hypothetical protein ACXQS7_01585 [Candidatus Syntropharchaeia archaeon]
MMLLEMYVVFLSGAFIVTLFIMLLMYTRIQQLTGELQELKSRIELTDDEISQLTRDMEILKKII